MPPTENEFVARILEAQRAKDSIAVLGIDPQLDSPNVRGVPDDYTLTRFCCEIIEACARHVIAVKPQLAYFEARGLAGMAALAEVIATARRCGLITIADAKRGDIGATSEAYADAFLGGGEFGCDAVTVNPYLGSDAIVPFLSRVRAGRGLFVLVKTSNPSSGEFQDLEVAGGGALWERIAERVNGWGAEFVAAGGLTPVGAVVGATYPDHARRARAVMPRSIILVPGYGTQGAGADDAVAAARADGGGIIVNASRSLMYAYRGAAELSVGMAAAQAAELMRLALKAALMRGTKTI
ncbi:MAG TPA: orotidine-5'-phosphate decarboxylase [Candidatus Binataceae bacterium]|nr:orotidine-5'-phosphate decarboxylase [Candidatus Binataceae bacterium]